EAAAAAEEAPAEEAAEEAPAEA
ncbi:MAG TPA: 30S ribosomal protein S16, partial [Bifidobacterium longum]|nr:30S ribosomal protein S16 [Bifidobacterium longum]